MRKILVTGGTVFVSKFVASWFAGRGEEVYVLNRNTRTQVPGVRLIEGDRRNLGDCLKGYAFDAVLDITSYTLQDVEDLVNALGDFRDYIFISSSAVYPETNPQPFREDGNCGENAVWGAYGTNKLAAENYLREKVPQAYILRPPYLYGPMQNVYREPFVFACAEAGRPFCMPGDGGMGLQFFHVEDLCRMMEALLEKHPAERIYNVGNPETVTVREWVRLCYDAVGAELETVSVTGHPQRAYFPFYDYDYRLDVARQQAILPDTKPLAEGLAESYAWFREHRADVNRKPLLAYIDEKILGEKHAENQENGK